MIYELSLVAKSELGEKEIETLTTIVNEVISAHDGETLLADDWGRVSFAQTTSTGTKTGRFLYFIYKANNKNNVELARRFRINDGVIKSLVCSKGIDKDQEEILKAYKTPFSKKHTGSVTDKEGEDGKQIGKDTRRFARKKSCWFMANQISADWKDPATFVWLVNEFGKISPARISGTSRRHQKLATLAIKRARQIGIASFLSNKIAY